MGIPAGTHTFGPENGSLWVKTGRGGAAAPAGHDLLILVTGWQATLEVGADPAQTRIELEVEPTSLRVRDGFGGMQPLGDEDKESIRETIDDEVLKRMDIGFRSTAVRTADDGRLSVQGDLTLVGNVRPIEFDLLVEDDGRLTGSVVVKQSEWGIEPYSALFGALKVADEVEVTVNAAWRGTPPSEEWEPSWEFRHLPVVDPGISSFVWALVFFLYLWFGMAAVGVSFGTALMLALLAGCFVFLYVRTHGMGRDERAS
jgi:polyisoprenoid-binding protein YceI